MTTPKTNEEIIREFMEKCRTSFAYGGFLTKDLNEDFGIDAFLQEKWLKEKLLTKNVVIGENNLDDEKLHDYLAGILNALPEIDPHDDEAWMTDKCFPKFKEFANILFTQKDTEIQKAREEERERIRENVTNLTMIDGLSAKWAKQEILHWCFGNKQIPPKQVTGNK